MSEYIETFLELLGWLFISVILAPIVNLMAAPAHLIYIVAVLFVIDVYVGIRTSSDGFSSTRFRRVLPKFIDASLMIVVMSMLANLHSYTDPLQLTGYILVSLWLTSNIVENMIKNDRNPNNPWRKVAEIMRDFTLIGSSRSSVKSDSDDKSDPNDKNQYYNVCKL